MIQKYLILIVCALAHIGAFGEGFLAGTLVKTPSGYTEIEKLIVGDQVVCYNFKGECVTRAVTHVQQEEVNAYAQITVGNDTIYAALDHKFYIPYDNTWVEAHKIQPDSVLLKHCTEYIPASHLQTIEASAVVYDITVDEYHNFCVGHEEVHVHNVLPFVAGFTINFFFGGGVAVAGTFGLGAIISKVVFDIFGSTVVPRTAQVDFNADIFGEQFNNPRRPYMAGKEDSAEDKGGKENKGDDKKPAEASNKPTNRPKPGEQAKPGIPTEAEGFKPPRNWSGEKERHPKTGQYGWRDKHGDYWIPANDHAGAHYDKVDKNGRYVNVGPGGKIRGGNK